MATLPVVPEWEPVLGAQLGLSEPRRTPSGSTRRSPDHGLQRLRMPANWPPDTELAMLVATYAKGGGKTVSYSLAAFRQAFAGGRDLGDEGTVLIAAAACEMHPRAVLKGVQLRSTRAALQRACARAAAAGRHRAARDRHRQRHLLRRAGARARDRRIGGLSPADAGEPGLPADRHPRRP